MVDRETGGSSEFEMKYDVDVDADIEDVEHFEDPANADHEEPKGGYRMRRWCLTSFKADVVETLSRLFEEKILRYYVCGTEVCPYTGRVHYQIYVEYLKAVRFSTLKDHFDNAHVEPAFSPAFPSAASRWCDLNHPSSNEFDLWCSHAATYCMKDGDFVEQGTSQSLEGPSADILQAAEELQADPYAPLSTRFKSQPKAYARALKLLDRLQAEYQRDAAQAKAGKEAKLIVLWGPPGSGKSSSVLKSIKLLGLKYLKVDGKQKTEKLWFDGYDGQPVIWLDDFSEDMMPLKQFLSFCDPYYEKRLEIKGGNVFAKPDYVFITCQKSPKKWYSNDADRNYDAAEIARRIHKMVELKPLNPDKAPVWNEVTTDVNNVETVLFGAPAANSGVLGVLPQDVPKELK